MITEKSKFKARVIELGYNLSGKDLNMAFKSYKELQEERKVTEAIDTVIKQQREVFKELAKL